MMQPNTFVYRSGIVVFDDCDWKDIWKSESQQRIEQSMGQRHDPLSYIKVFKYYSIVSEDVIRRARTQFAQIFNTHFGESGFVSFAKRWNSSKNRDYLRSAINDIPQWVKEESDHRSKFASSNCFLAQYHRAQSVKSLQLGEIMDENRQADLIVDFFKH
jgi:hypothetical protein